MSKIKDKVEGILNVLFNELCNLPQESELVDAYDKAQASLVDLIQQAYIEGSNSTNGLIQALHKQAPAQTEAKPPTFVDLIATYSEAELRENIEGLKGKITTLEEECQVWTKALLFARNGLSDERTEYARNMEQQGFTFAFVGSDGSEYWQTGPRVRQSE